MGATLAKAVGDHLAAVVGGLNGQFPKADLEINEKAGAAADSLLNDVRQEIGSMNGDVLTYFDCARDRYRITLQLLVDHPRGKVLDMGCSPGHGAMALTKAGFDVYGIDLNTEYLKKYLNTDWVKRLKIIQVPFERETIPYPDGFFDYILFTEVLEHIAITDPAKIMMEIKRLLRPGGFLILSTPNVCHFGHVLALLKGQNVFWDPPIFYGGLDRHNREYTPREVFGLMERAHFSRVQIGYFNTPSNWNAKTAAEVYELWNKWQAIPELHVHPTFKNTIFVKATK